MRKLSLLFVALCSVVVTGCATPPELPSAKVSETSVESNGDYQYRIGSGDLLSVTVWRNPDVSGDYVVGPDGTINMALTKSIIATGLTVTELRDLIAKSLSDYIKNPQVTVTVKNAVSSAEQIRVIGTAAKPIAVPFKKGMTILDLMIITGGLSTYADGNAAVLIRNTDAGPKEHRVRLKDLIQKGDMKANVELRPGDVIRIPEAWF